MATVYSLICFGGRTGKTVTFTDDGDVVNLTKNGLRAGAGVIFSTTGSLPTGLNAGTTYYARPGADENKFLLYPTPTDAIDGTNQVTFSGIGTGTHTVKGAYFSGLTSEQLARYGTSGSERIYDGAASFVSARSAATTGFDEEVCEVGEAWSDYAPALSFTMTKAPLSYITSMVNGVRSPAFHNGVPGNGYWLVNSSASQITINDFCGVEGITVRHSSALNGRLLVLNALQSFAKNCIFYGQSTSFGEGVWVLGALSRLENCLSLNFLYGIVNAGGNQAVVCNNIAVKNGTGIRPDGNATTNRLGHWRNNISVGNTTNWAVEPTSLQGATNNFGESSDTPWAIGSGTTGVMATTDFVDFANNDFRPAASTSPQVDAGVEYYAMPATDINGDKRPNYNNGGAEGVDVGCYEFDHGYGPHPASATISLTSIVSGSRVLITKASDGTVLYNDVPGTSLSFSTTHIGEFNVVVRKATASPFYREFNASGTTVADQTTSIKCLQQLDE